MWQREVPAHGRLGQEWHVILERYGHMGIRGKWNAASGPTAALILTLQEIHWVPREPDERVDPRGDRWKFTGSDVLDFREPAAY